MSNEGICKRKSNIELLKIVAMVFITMSHCLPVYGGKAYAGWFDENISSIDFNVLLVLFLRHVGQIGNIIFVVCAAWFLVEDNRVKITKVINILLDGWILSVVSMLIGMACGISFTKGQIFRLLLPTTNQLNWFVGCYLLLYLVHGLLNVVINDIDKKRLFLLTASMFSIYGVICTFYAKWFYYTRLLCFILVYFMVAYMKKYLKKLSDNKKMNGYILLVSAVAYVGSIIVYLILAAKIGFLDGKAIKFSNTNNFIMIIMVLAIFNIFRTTEIEHSLFINRIASASLMFYLLTENYVLANYARPKMFEWIYIKYGYSILPVWLLIINVITLVTGTALAYLYCSTIGKISFSVSKVISRKINNFGDKILARVMEIS